MRGDNPAVLADKCLFAPEGITMRFDPKTELVCIQILTELFDGRFKEFTGAL